MKKMIFGCTLLIMGTILLTTETFLIVGILLNIAGLIFVGKSFLEDRKK
jgi:hypothetical protein